MVQLTLVLGPAVVLGIIVGLYEAFLIHRDVKVPGHRIWHMSHSVILSVLFIICIWNN